MRHHAAEPVASFILRSLPVIFSNVVRWFNSVQTSLSSSQKYVEYIFNAIVVILELLYKSITQSLALQLQ